MEKETEPLSRFNTEEKKGTVRVDELLKQSSLPPVNVRREETPEIIEVHVSSRRSEKDEEERKMRIKSRKVKKKIKERKDREKI